MQHVRVTVLSGGFCINRECRFCLMTILGTTTHYADCARRDCDNHKPGHAPIVAPMPSAPPFELPSPDSTRPIE